MTLQDALNTLFPGNAGVTVPHGTPEGGSIEEGVDIALPAGYGVRAVQSGLYRPDLSTNYQEVLQTGPSDYQSYTHVDSALTALAPVYVPAGTVIGTVSKRIGAVQATNGAGGTVDYHSTGYHVEFGDYSTPQGAAYFTGGNDPAPVLEQAAGAGNQLAAAVQSAASWATSTISPQHIVIALLAIVGLVLILRR